MSAAWAERLEALSKIYEKQTAFWGRRRIERLGSSQRPGTEATSTGEGEA